MQESSIKREATTTTTQNASRTYKPLGPHYKWIALSNTTLGVLMATINGSIVLISLPAIFSGIGINPLAPGETNYFLWLLLGYMVVTATLLVTFGRISDMFGRVRLYNLGFAVFTLGSILLFVTPGSGNTAALELIIFRLVQAVGAGFLFANSTAILTDAFPAHERGMAMGINQIAAILGSIIGLILGGVLAVINWRVIFLVSVPIGLFGTVWAYLMLRETATIRAHQKIDWAGNITFAGGLTILLVGITYGIQPYGTSSMGWTNPLVLGAIGLGILLLALFVWIELRVSDPMFHLGLFKIRMFTAGNISGFLAAVARGGLQFMLIIWLQGIWLPLHGYSFEVTPLWSGIYMLPLLIGFIIMGPLSGYLSDRFGARLFSTLGMVIQAVAFFILTFLPANFDYLWFAILLFILGIATFQNAATLVSLGAFFSIIIIGLAATLSTTLFSGLTQAGVPGQVATTISHLPPTAALFAAFLGYNPMATLLPASVLHTLPAASQAHLLSKSYFPNLISSPFMVGLHAVFYLAAVLCLISAFASLLRGQRYIHDYVAQGAVGVGSCVEANIIREVDNGPSTPSNQNEQGASSSVSNAQHTDIKRQ